MKTITRKRILLFAVTLVMVLAALSVPASLAYFSDQSKASGDKGVKLGWETVLDEKIEGNDKHVTIENKGDTDAIVRVAVFAADFATVQPGGDWQLKNGWYYYKKILKSGEKTSELVVEVKAEESSKADFNIIVVHESSRTVYSDNNTLKVPDGWDFAPNLKQ